jgi:hypothetical protein
MQRIQSLLLIVLAILIVLACGLGCGGSMPGTAKSTLALEGWTCSPWASGGPGGACPDCVLMCARLESSTVLRLGVFVDTAMTGWLCTGEATVKQGVDTLFSGELDLDAVDLSSTGFTEAGSETVDAQEGGVTVEGDGEAGTSCP